MFAIYDEIGEAVTPDEAKYTERCVNQGMPCSKHNTINLIKRILEEKIPGDLAECGVNAGAHPACMAYTLSKYGATDRRVHLYDSFQGMPQAGVEDEPHERQILGLNLDPLHGKPSNVCLAYQWQVEQNMRSWHVNQSLLVYHGGWLQERLPMEAASLTLPQLALLRVDVDLHDSTIPVFRYLFPRVSPGGYVISDDWGESGVRHSQGAHQCQRAALGVMRELGFAEPKVTRLSVTTGTVWWKKI